MKLLPTFIYDKETIDTGGSLYFDYLTMGYFKDTCIESDSVYSTPIDLDEVYVRITNETITHIYT